MLDVKSATNSAITFLHTIYKPNNFQDIMLEEVELSDDERYWYITIGFSKKTTPTGLHALKGLVVSYERVFKIFRVDTKTGEVKSMKIRKSE